MNKVVTEHKDRLHVCNLYCNNCTSMLPYKLANPQKRFYVFVYGLLTPRYEQEAHRYWQRRYIAGRFHELSKKLLKFIEKICRINYEVL